MHAKNTDHLFNASRYDTEADLVEDFLGVLCRGESPWGVVEATTEWDYRTGITDVLIRTDDGCLVAFEAKLTDWRRATYQAYRNTTFVERVYVVMPIRAAERAQKHPEVFSRYGIGLCSVQGDRVSIVIEAPSAKDEPIMPWMNRKAHLFFDEVTKCGSDVANSRNRSRGMRKA